MFTEPLLPGDLQASFELEPFGCSGSAAVQDTKSSGLRESVPVRIHCNQTHDPVFPLRSGFRSNEAKASVFTATSVNFPSELLFELFQMPSDTGSFALGGCKLEPLTEFGEEHLSFFTVLLRSML